MRHTVKKILDYGNFFLLMSLLGNILNLFFNFYLGRVLSVKDFSLVALLMSILYATNIFLNALAVTTNHSVGISPLFIRQKVLWHILSLWRREALSLGLFFATLWVACSPFLAKSWDVSIFSIISFLPIFFLGLLVAIHRGILQGNSQFTRAGAVFLSESGVKLFSAIIFVFIGFGEFSYLSIPLSVIASFLVSTFLVWSFNVKTNKIDQLIPINVFSRRFFVFSFLLGLSTLSFLSFDIILAKTFFPPHEAGGYALLSLVGKIIFLSSSLFEGLIVSFVSNALSENKKTKDIFWAFLSISLLVVTLTSGFFLLFGEQILSAFFGEKIAGAVHLLPMYVTAMAVFSVSHAVVFYHHARREFIFSILASLFSGFLILGTIFFHESIGQFVEVFLAVSVLQAVLVLIFHVIGKYHRINLEDPKYLEEDTEKYSKKKLPTVTIGIPAYNEQLNIGNILQRVLSQEQTWFLIEKIVVVSDGSTDDTVEIASQYLHAGVQVIPRKENRGLNYTQNEIIKGTRTDILVLLNADILLNDNKVLIRLVDPILNGADLSASWTRPLTPKTFLEKILYAGFDMKHYVYVHYRNGDNIYTCIGANRALSKNFFSQVEFPLSSEGEDQYLYLRCISGGYKYRYAGFVNSYFRLPSEFGDYKKYAKRIFRTQTKYQEIFGDIAKTERFLPKRVVFLGLIHGLLKQPVYTILYIFLHLGIRWWALRQPISSSNSFDISTKTKELF